MNDFMKDDPFGNFRSTLNMPELARFQIRHYTGFRSPKGELALSGFGPNLSQYTLGSSLVVMNAFLDDMTPIDYANVHLVGPKRYSFYLGLTYKPDSHWPFHASLSPRHKLDFPFPNEDYKEWQAKLTELVNRLHV